MKKEKGKEKNLEEKYVKLDPIQHILKRPDTYIGSIEEENAKLWVFSQDTKRLVQKDIIYVPGLYKIFDEILVNAADHFQNHPKQVTYIKVEIDRSKNIFSVENNGPGIEVQIHKDEKVYIPELIFGNLNTSSNYDDSMERITGGRNGLGAKLTNVFSKQFIIETYDSSTKKYYRQVFSENMTKKHPPEITQEKREPFTKISFVPDLSKLSMTCISDDFYSLLVKRVYDLAGVTPKSLQVYLNNEKIEVKDFESYVSLYIESTKPEESAADSSSDSEESDDESTNENTKKKAATIDYVFARPNERWEVAMALSDYQFQQVSFVNSICTSKGGTHVNHFCDKIIDYIQTQIKKKGKAKTEMEIKNNQIKQHLWVFVNCKIVNPTFDSQTKENMNLKPSSFGSDFELEESFLKKIVKTGIIDQCIKIAKVKEEFKLQKQLNKGVTKSGKVYGIPKLEDANMAGTRNSEQCTLILTEGDSAKSLAMAGIEVVGRDKFGVFPLKGKLLNVRDANSKKIVGNDEIQNIMKILGLHIGVEYENTKNLRYGSLMIMTDQDHDGSHIKGLIINLINHFWPTLFKMNGFLKQFITPILKMTRGRDEVKSFYTISDYNNFIREELGGNSKGWKIKYYKGLGTSTDKEAKEYFSQIEDNRIGFEYNDPEDEKVIDMVFSKIRAQERKEWLAKFDSTNDIMNYDADNIRYKDFINKEFIHFSNSDNIRSIPSLCDGLKPSERKILFSCFKRNLKDEIKVAQLSGYVSEHSAYHHGEASLQGTIVAMSQNYVGSNNINLLLPIGQFGTRNAGGKDHASSRYIYTNLNPITRHLFNKDDDNLLEYQIEENQKIEPKWYLPILPLVLVNGTEGIGTGWSTRILEHNPREIANLIKKRLQGQEFPDFIDPFYKGFMGKISTIDNKQYLFKGNFHWQGNTLIITELPIESWTRNYKEFLEMKMGIEVKESNSKEKAKKKDKKAKKKEKEEDDQDKKKKKKNELEKVVSDFTEHHTNNRVEFRVIFEESYLSIYKQNEDKLTKDFRLVSSKSVTNMVLFDKDGKIRKYNKTKEILDDFYELRLGFYKKRKIYLESLIKKELEIASNKARFIIMIVDEKLKVSKKAKNQIINELISYNFTPMSEINKMIKNFQTSNDSVNLDAPEGANAEDEEEVESTSEPAKLPGKEFDYLLNMPLWNLTKEKVEQLRKEKEKKEDELKILQSKTEGSLWIEDLDKFVSTLDEIEMAEEKERLKEIKPGEKKGAKSRARKNNKGGANEDKKKSNKNDIETNLKAMLKKKDNDSIAADLSVPLRDRIALSKLITKYFITENSQAAGNDKKRKAKLDIFEDSS